MTPEHEAIFLKQFATLGEDAVRLMVVTDRYGDDVHRLAITWLAERDNEEDARKDASQAEQIRTALSAKNAAWIAAIAAIIAAILAAISIVVALK